MEILLNLLKPEVNIFRAATELPSQQCFISTVVYLPCAFNNRYDAS